MKRLVIHRMILLLVLQFLSTSMVNNKYNSHKPIVVQTSISYELLYDNV